MAPSSAKVLYFDGEMPPDLMRDRDRGLGEGEIEILNHAILFDRTGQEISTSSCMLMGLHLTSIRLQKSATKSR